MVRFVEVDGGDRVAGQLGSDPTFGVAEADERPQQVRGLRQVGGVGDDLARDPVLQDDLDRHGTPAQRIAGAVVGAEPDHRLEEAAVVGVVERRPERRGEEPVGQLLLVPLAPLRPFVADATGGHLPGEPLDDRAAHGPGVGLERRDGHRRTLDRLGDADPGVGQVEIAPHGVGIVDFARMNTSSPAIDSGTMKASLTSVPRL